MLFQLQGTDVHLLGSYHFGRGTVSLPPTAARAIAEAKLIAWESSEAAAGPAFKAAFRRGASLAACLDDKLLARVHSVAEDVGADVEDVDRADPWLAALLLFIPLALNAGYSVEEGVDAAVRKIARDARVKDYFLEMPSDGLDAFARAPLEEQVAGLRLLVESPAHQLERIDRIASAWRTADLAGIESALDQALSEMPVTYDNLIHGRNLQWLPKIRVLLAKRKKVVVCVGALHLVGRFGLPSLLEQDGIKVTFVPD